MLWITICVKVTSKLQKKRWHFAHIFPHVGSSGAHKRDDDGVFFDLA